MAVPIEFKRQAFSQASFHGLVRVVSVPGAFTAPYGVVHICAEIKQIFRDSLGLPVGELIEFDLPVARKSSDEVPMGGAFCWYEDVLAQPLMEICLNGQRANLRLACDLFEIVDDGAFAPNFRFEQTTSGNNQHSSRRWWQIWK
jgi:hypothetical protein